MSPWSMVGDGPWEYLWDTLIDQQAAEKVTIC